MHVLKVGVPDMGFKPLFLREKLRVLSSFLVVSCWTLMGFMERLYLSFSSFDVVFFLFA